MVAFRLQPGAILFLLFPWFFSSPVAAGIVNRTIDDSFGDSQTQQLVTYLPSTGGVWKDETCIGCAINPDVSQTFKGTYTAATYNPGLGSINITMKFNGTAIYVFFVLANNAGDGITTLTLANFTLDGNPPQLFQHAPDLTTTDFEYNQLVFSQTNLINAEHTLVISTSGVNTNVYVDFDYAIYTHDDDAPLLPLPTGGTQTTSTPVTTSKPATTTDVVTTVVTTTNPTTVPPSPTTTIVENGTTRITQVSSNPTTTPRTSSTRTSGAGGATTSISDLNQSASSKSGSTGAIAGGVVGGVIVLVLIVLFFFLRWRRKRQPNFSSEEGSNAIPDMTQSSFGRSQQDTVVSPFTPTAVPIVATSPNVKASQSRVPLVDTQSPSISSFPSHGGSFDILSAYGGIAESTSSSLQYLSGSDAPTSGSDSAGRLLPVRRGPRQQFSVSNGDDTSTAENVAAAAAGTPSSPNDIEFIRRTRQQEIDQQLRTVQEEMLHLTSDLRNGEKGRVERRSVRRHQTLNRGAPEDAGNELEEEEMSMADMKEQLRALREQIGYLQDQQRSAWAQGLSDDPPPGYTPARQSHSPPLTADLIT